ncbi:hypothetical protein DFS34DRAFT_403334 [Phlyctochytrium arcticum]|nr:hypothetical protein DFS34DRAFT_403334 [Phlyctochytrium arcticum]
MDTSDFYAEGRPEGGWYTTPIHTTLLNNGKVYVVGWDRRDYKNCVKPDGTRKHGVSFIIDPEDIVKAGQQPKPQNAPQPTFVIPKPITDLRKNKEDTLYCSGQVTMKDGRVFVVGGASYENVGGTNEVEVGLNYARILDPVTGNYTVSSESPIGTMWYPTAAVLTSGDVLVTGGFARCCDGDNDANDNVGIYHPKNDTWTLLGPVADHNISPGIKDYTHTWVVPEPVEVGGLPRHLLMMGHKGKMLYYNTDKNTPNEKRAIEAPNGNRPLTNGGDPTGWDSTAFYSPNGELVTLGGGQEPQRVDFFNVDTNTWRSHNTSYQRDNSISVLLPDGTALVMGGTSRNDSLMVPPPQLYDPFTDVWTTLQGWSNDNQTRAYHSNGLLLKDGRVLVGGGIDNNNGHDIACERVDMRVFTPPYLQGKGKDQKCITRPVIDTQKPITFTIAKNAKTTSNPTTTITYSGPKLRSVRGAALMALGSFTHAFDQNQRYIPLDIESSKDGSVVLSVANCTAPIEGPYNLFLISEDGVPSVGALSQLKVV